jgi:aquaporin Z
MEPPKHWPEYLIEAAALATFMVSACVFTVIFEHPGSPVRAALPGAFGRRVLTGAAMALTAIGIIYSPFGKRSGAHMNPAVTATFYLLGKIGFSDAAFYIAAQFLGGSAGVALAGLLIGNPLRDAAVNYAATVPGPAGSAAAFAAEFAISLLLMLTVLCLSNRPGLNRYTGLAAGVLVALYISFEAPYSGMSMNPARTLGSALPAHLYTALWVYFTAPFAGMLLAQRIYRSLPGARSVLCAKLHHENHQPCIFRCNYRKGVTA